MLADELTKKTGTHLPNSNEVLADLSALEATRPVGTGLEDLWKQFPDMEQWAQSNRRRDLMFAPGAIPKPDVKTYPNKSTGIKDFLEQLWRMMKR